LSLINDENNQIYLAKIKKYNDFNFKNNTNEFKSYIAKENTNNRNAILKTYDLLLNSKYEIDINQKAINSIKNLFQ